MNPPTRVCAVALTLVAMSILSSSAFAQIQDLRESRFPGPERKADKIDFLYKVSNAYFTGGTLLDMSTTYRVLRHPTIARRADNAVLAHYQGIETGWAGRFGRRNTAAAIGANVALNVGLSFLSRKLYRRGGRWRILAIGVNVLKGTDNIVAGIHNARYSAGVDGDVRMATGYSGPIYWSR